MSYVCTDTDGRIQSVTELQEFAGPDAFEFIFPDDFDFGTQADYCIANGELVHDPVPMSEEQKQYEEETKRQKQLQTATIMFVNESAPNFTDKQALALDLLFETWVVGMNCKKDHIVRYDGELYRIGQDHTAQEQWKPGDKGTTALYSHINITEEGYEVWKAWDGVSGIYKKDQIVEDPENGLLYKSKIDNNVWGPPHTTPDYWELYVESEI